MKKIILATVLIGGVTLSARPARAQWAVIDGAAIAQDLEEFLQVLTQWNEVINRRRCYAERRRERRRSCRRRQ